MDELIENRYRKLNEQYSGGSADVLIYQDQYLERKVAIKFLLPIRDKKHLYDEIAALERIRSKHVVQIYDVVVLPHLNNRTGLVQEYITGNQVRPPNNLNGYLVSLYQMASGIADIHAQGLIHRDIKLQNMKIDAEGIIKIFDFDIARFLENSHTNHLKLFLRKE